MYSQLKGKLVVDYSLFIENLEDIQCRVLGYWNSKVVICLHDSKNARKRVGLG